MRTMRGRRGYLFAMCLAVLLAATLVPTSARAVVVRTGCAGGDFGAECSMAELLAGGSIRIDQLLFGSFANYSSIGTGTPVAASTIQVSPLGEGTDQVGLRYQGPWIALSDQFIDTLWDYTVTSLAGDIIKDNKLILDGFSAQTVDPDPGALILIAESARDENNVDIVDKQVFDVDGTSSFILKVFPPQDFLHVFKDVFLAGGDEVTEIAFLSDWRQEFSIPEPTALLLLGSGLLGLLGVQRFFLRK